MEWCRVTRHPRIFCGLTGCQKTPGEYGVNGPPGMGCHSNMPLPITMLHIYVFYMYIPTHAFQPIHQLKIYINEHINSK